MSPSELFTALRLPFPEGRSHIYLPPYVSDTGSGNTLEQDVLLEAAWDQYAAGLNEASHMGYVASFERLRQRLKEEEASLTQLKRRRDYVLWLVHTYQSYAERYGAASNVASAFADEQWTREDWLGNHWHRSSFGLRAEVEDGEGDPDLIPPEHIRHKKDEAFEDIGDLEHLALESTWKEVVSRVIPVYQWFEEEVGRLRQLCGLLRFRESMAENVIWYFELYGFVPRWKEVRARKQVVQRVVPFVKLPYPDDLPFLGTNRFRRNAKFLNNGRFIMNRDAEADAQRIQSGAKRADFIGLRLHETFSIDASDFTYKHLQRVREAHDARRFLREGETLPDT